MKSIFENVIRKGDYDLTDILAKINTYHIEGKLSDADRDELITLARNGADMRNNVDVLAKLEDLDRRIKALEDGEPTGDSSEYPDYVVGKWYYPGDGCTFEGKKYICIAPTGAVCTWNPVEYPAYWEEVK